MVEMELSLFGSVRFGSKDQVEMKQQRLEKISLLRFRFSAQNFNLGSC